MTSSKSYPKAAVGLFTAILTLACSPIWGVRFFVNHDGSAHLYTSYLMLELIKKNRFFSDTFGLNSLAVPNSSGHWITAGFLTVLPPEIVTKTILTLTLAMFASAVVWLRWRVDGRSELLVTILFAFAVGTSGAWAAQAKQLMRSRRRWRRSRKHSENGQTPGSFICS